MINEFTGIGNLGQAPTLRNQAVNNETRSVVNVRIFFDRPVRQDDETFKDKGGFWLSVAFWGHLANEAMRLLNKGARVCVIGRLQENQWIDKDTGEERSELQLTAEHLFIHNLCIEKIEYRSRKALDNEEPGSAGDSAFDQPALEGAD